MKCRVGPPGLADSVNDSRGLVLPKLCRVGSGKEAEEGNEPSTPSKKKQTLLWISSLSLGRLLLLFSKFRRWGDGYCRKGIYDTEILGAPVQAVMEIVGLGQLKNVKMTVLMLGVMNFAIFNVAVLVAFGTSKAQCSRNLTVASLMMAVAAGMRLFWMLGMAFAQAVTASTMIAEQDDTTPLPSSNITRRQRQRWYMRWLWWSRLGTIMTVLQIFVLCYFVWFLARNVRISGRNVIFCPRGDAHLRHKWLMVLMLVLPAVGGIIVIGQFCAGSDVLAWRLLYGAHYEAWKAHYRQMFDYGIREVLCCLGRRRYMSFLENDEVDSVSALLCDLVAYRAAGASHLEVIAGVSLLKEESARMSPVEELPPAPEALLTEATLLHPYAEAAYTGLLLDVGRHPLTFPCAWLYRQGVLTPWDRNGRPALEGDNCWRGHAAAFLDHAKLPPKALRQGRVLQTNRESVYFVVVLEKLKTVLVAIRGTETPEDLITDGLGTESALTKSDLRGILENNTISYRVRQEVLATMPHFGHVGVIEAARELSIQLDNLAEDNEILQIAAVTSSATDQKNPANLNGSQALLSPDKTGLLSSLLGPGGECEGYSLRLVGHSLGGAIATLTGLRLASRFPNLHVYAFGVLPCVDVVTAEACSPFVTSIIYNDEFSSRLSVAAIMRLRAAALRALATDSNTDAALVSKLTRRLFKSKSKSDIEETSNQGSLRIRNRYSNALKGGAFLCSHACRCLTQMPEHSSYRHPSVQLASFKHENCRDFESGTWKEMSQLAVAETSRNVLDSTKTVVGGFQEQVSKDKSRNSGVRVPDGEGGVGLGDAGTEINEEEAVALMSSKSEREEHEQDIHEDNTGSLELLDNGMPKDMGDFCAGSDVQELWPAEMFVPGLVVHIIRTIGDSKWFGLPTSLTFSRQIEAQVKPQHTAVLKDRRLFRDILVSPSMFLDHMPWKCQYALNDCLGKLRAAKQRQGSSSVETTVDV